jgi:hypothetical protein
MTKHGVELASALENLQGPARGPPCSLQWAHACAYLALALVRLLVVAVMVP